MPRAWEPRNGRLPVPPTDPPADLAFIVEHHESIGARPTVIGRAAKRVIAEAIFEAASRDRTSGTLVLKHGATVLRTRAG